MQTALYIRVSTIDQAKHGHSIQGQESRLRAYAESKDLSNIKLYIDDGHSGSSLNRPQMTQLIRDVESNLINTVVVYKLDRLSRSQRDTLHLIEEIFNKHDTALISINESFDTSTPFGRAMVGMLSVFAQLERESITERMMMGKQEGVKKGKWVGGHTAPFGYDRIDKVVYVNDYEANIVREIYRSFLAGESSHAMYYRLNDKYNNIFNNAQSIMYILKNPYYIGKQRFQNEIYDAPQPAIVSEETYNKVQVIIDKRRERYVPELANECILRGLIKCGKCGAHFVTRNGGKYKGRTHRYYVCSNFAHRYRLPEKDHCTQKSINIKKAHQLVMADLRKISSEEIEKDKNEEVDEMKIYKTELNKVEKQMERLTDLYINETISLDILNNKMADLKFKKESIEKNIINHKPKRDIAILEMKQFEEVDFDSLTYTEQHNMLALIIDRIEINDRDFKIHYNFAQ